MEATAEATNGRISAELLKLVQRPETGKDGEVVMEGKGENARPKLRPVRAKEVLDWREYEDRVVVVTTDGQKFTGEKPSK
jgi:hypothetical protein